MGNGGTGAREIGRGEGELFGSGGGGGIKGERERVNCFFMSREFVLATEFETIMNVKVLYSVRVCLPIPLSVY
jgi:hypothetical protein